MSIAKVGATVAHEITTVPGFKFSTRPY